MKKALSYMMIGALTSSAIMYCAFSRNTRVNDLKMEKNKMIDKFKEMFK